MNANVSTTAPLAETTSSARWVLLALAIGAFGIGTTEFSPMGLLPVIANGVDESPNAMPIAAMTPPPPGPGAPPPPAHNGAAYWIKVSAQEDGSFTVTNSRNGFSKRYGARAATATR